MNLFDELRGDPRVASDGANPPDPDGRCVLYWMRRAQRAFDNPALETALRIANELRLPTLVFFRLNPRRAQANARHLSFMLEGLAETATGLERRGVGFAMRLANAAHAAGDLARIAREVRPAAIVIDRDPLQAIDGWRAARPAAIAVPRFCVDADMIVPAAAIGREHYAARTIRPRIHERLERFLTPVGNRNARVRWRGAPIADSLAPAIELIDTFGADRAVGAVADFRGGASVARVRLRRFVRERLNGYASERNQPQKDATSQLSPYLHYGQIGPHTVAIAVRDAAAPEADRRAFLEELIVRRELAINFTIYNRRFARIESCERWALESLAAHRADPRAHMYSERQFANAETHDPLWNAAQRQMVESGWMHGYMRMYWAKKILEWSRSPRAAYEIAVRLNDRYELDGRDPNGYAGIAWAIGGKHDRAWGPERPIYGKVRYMSAASTGRKFDRRAYIARWRGDRPIGGAG